MNFNSISFISYHYISNNLNQRSIYNFNSFSITINETFKSKNSLKVNLLILTCVCTI